MAQETIRKTQHIGTVIPLPVNKGKGRNTLVKLIAITVEYRIP